MAMAAKSPASCTEAETSTAQPAARQAIASPWSPKIERPWAARARPATCTTTGKRSPAHRNRLGSISNSPWEAVKVVVSAPAWRAPCTAPAAPPSLCSSTTLGTAPQRLGRPAAPQASAHSPIGVAGVIG